MKFRLVGVVQSFVSSMFERHMVAALLRHLIHAVGRILVGHKATISSYYIDWIGS